MKLDKGFRVFVTVVFAVVFAVSPAAFAAYPVSAAKPELTFPSIDSDSKVTSDVNGVKISFESDQEGTIIYYGECVSDTIEAKKGKNDITFKNVPEGEYDEGDCKIRIFNNSGDISDTIDVPEFTVDKTSPKLSLAEGIDSPLSTAPVVKLALSEDADKLEYDGVCDSSTTTATAGTVSLTLRKASDKSDLPSGTYSDCTVVAMDEAGNKSSEFRIPEFELILAGDVFINQTGVVEDPTGDLADEGARVITVFTSHAGELYSTTPTACLPHPNKLDKGYTKIHLSLDDVNFSAGSGCDLRFDVELGGTTQSATLVVGAGTAAKLPNLSAAADGVDPDITESTADLVTQDNGSTVGFRFTSDEGGTWRIQTSGTCSDTIDAAGVVPLNNIVVPGSNTVIFETATGGIADGTYGQTGAECDIQITDLTGNSTTINMPEFTINDNKGPNVTITKGPVSPVTSAGAAGGDVVVRFTSDEFIATANIIEAKVDLDGDCFDTDENPNWAFADLGISNSLATPTTDIVTTARSTDMSVYNTLTLTGVSNGTYSNCQVRFEDAAGNRSNTLNIPSFTVGQSGPELTDASFSAGTVKNPVTLEFESDKSGTFNFTDATGAVDSDSPCRLDGKVENLPLKSGDSVIVVDNMDTGAATCYITGFDSEGRASSPLAFGPFTVGEDDDPDIKSSGVVDPNTLTYKFTSETGGDITYDGFCSSTTTRAVKGGKYYSI